MRVRVRTLVKRTSVRTVQYVFKIIQSIFYGLKAILKAVMYVLVHPVAAWRRVTHAAKALITNPKSSVKHARKQFFTVLHNSHIQGSPAGFGVILAAGALLVIGLSGGHAAPPIVEYQTPGLSPSQLTVGPDGNFWFTDSTNNAIGKMTPEGTVTQYPIPSTRALPQKITAGPDGNLWFTEMHFGANKIGKITTDGVITEYPIPTPFAFPVGIVAGPDGNIWFTESASGKIGKLNPSLGPTDSNAIDDNFNSGMSGSANPYDIIVGPDGNLWFTEVGGGDFNPSKIGRITMDGIVTEYGTGLAAQSGLQGLAAGADGNIWFTQYNTNKIGKLEIGSGNITEFDNGLTPGSSPNAIIAGPDGELWFTESSGNNIGKIALDGTINEYPLAAGSQPNGIVAGPDGNIWFAGTGNNYIGKVLLTNDADTQSPSTVAPLSVGTITQTSVALSWNAATDNVGVTGYRLFRGPNAGNLTEVTTTINTSYMFAGLNCETTYVFAVEAYDLAGNSSAKEITDPLATNACTAPDTTPPETTITSSTINGTTGTLTPGSVTVASTAFFGFASSEVDSTFECKLDSGSYTDCSTGSISYSNLSAGAHTFSVRATDITGNIDPSPAMLSWTRDITNPSLTMVSPPNGSIVRGSSVAISATASDNGGGDIQSVQFKRCDSWGVNCVNIGAAMTPSAATGNPPTLYSTTWDTTGLSGPYTLVATAVDTAGNAGSAANIAVTVDNDNPAAVAMTAPSNGSTVSGSNVTVSATASDNVDGSGIDRVQFRLDCPGVNCGDLSSDNTASNSTYSISWNTSTLADGVHTLSAVAYDKAGNSLSSSNISVTVTNTPPPDITAPSTPSGLSLQSANSVTTSTITIKWNQSTDQGSPSTGIGGYKVYRATSQNGTYTYVQDVIGLTSYTDTGLGLPNNTLVANTTYYYKVAAYDNAPSNQTPPGPNLSTQSSSFSATTAASPAPTLTFVASSTSVTPGGSTTFSWTSTNATSCVALASPATSSWNGVKTFGTNQTQALTNLTVTTTYSLKCTGLGGEVTKTVVVTVSQPNNPPTNPTPAKKTGDLNDDQRVNIYDLAIFLSKYNSTDATADWSNNGRVDIYDLAILLANYEG